MSIPRILGSIFALSAFQAAAAVMCDISGTNEKGVEFSLAMEQAGAEKANRQLIAEQVGVVHREDDDFYPDELVLKDPSGQTKGYSAKHCFVRLSHDPTKRGYSNKSIVRCAGWGEQLKGTYYRFNPAAGAFVCEKNCGSNVPQKLKQDGCNEE